MATAEQKVKRNMINLSEKFEILGVELQWKLTGTETDYQYCVLEAVVPPGVVVPPHRHPDQEAFFVVSGAPEFASERDGFVEWCFATPGEMIHIPPMSLHGLRNPTDSDVTLLITCSVGLGDFFREAGLPYQHQSPYRSAMPSVEQIGRVLEIGERFGHVYPQNVPGRTARCGSGPLDHALGRLLTHPERPSYNRAYLI